MKSLVTVVFAALLLMAGQAGCADDGGSKDDTKTTSEEPQKKAAPLPGPAIEGADSLAAMRVDIRSEKNPIVTIVTDYGDMTLELYHDVAPAHADSFLARTKDGFYNGLIFHRILKEFMIQTGCPQGTGSGNAGYTLTAEFNELPHNEGTLSMARSRNPNSASSQFFICTVRNRSTASLDGKYTVFGQLIKGFDVLKKLASVEVINNGRGEVSKPAAEQYMRLVYASDAEGKKLK